ncbi:MAG: 16S rRNA (guanine(527)-N(7))-methyltransferase RsmG [Tenericutes bacterium HGW-Tenericutes-5]|jgi:16S rRNA (guanine527-N7)-methyltransferase|nr:MAG: 16S rRNA (guanine(527)-N(7))-methyltransferase RsmG [Tenericutes bacterium HGW-Tenericutes-5]
MEIINFKFNQELWDLLKNPSFSVYFENLIEKNKVMNLTNITEEKEVYQKHFYDSVILSAIFELGKKSILDIGAGAGFPSIPLKILVDSLDVTIIDGLNKRINYLKELTEKLKLSNVSLLHGRAEEMSKNKSFDFVTARAVAKLNILSEIALPYVKKDGYFVAYKSINYQEELEEAKNAIKVLGAQLERIVEYEINKDLKHVLLVFKKIKETPSIYPRQFAKIKKQPL